MVRIPIYDSPQVGYQPANLPQASAPNQEMVMGTSPQSMAQAGQATMQAGQGLFEIGSQMGITEKFEARNQQRELALQQEQQARIAAHNDKIRAQQAELQANSAFNIYSETSTKTVDAFKLMPGMEAMTNYASTMKKMESDRRAAEKTLEGNQIALQMFRIKADKSDSEYRAQIVNYHDKSLRAAAIGEGEASIERQTKAIHGSVMSMGISDFSYDPKTGAPQGAVQSYLNGLADLESELQAQSQRKGIPVGSNQYLSERDTLYDKLNTRIVDDLLAAGRNEEALKYYQFAGSTIQDPKVKERVVETTIKARRAEGINKLESAIRAQAQKPIEQTITVGGEEKKFTVEPRLIDVAIDTIAAQQAAGQLTAEEAGSMRARFIAEQNQIDESKDKRKAQALADVTEWSLQAGQGATLQQLLTQRPDIAVRLNKAGVLFEGEKIIKENGKPSTDAVGIGLLRMTQENLRQIQSEDALLAMGGSHLSQDDFSKVRTNWRQATGRTDPRSAKETEINELAEQYFTDSRNRGAYVKEDAAYANGKVRDQIILRNAEKDNRRTSFMIFFRQKAEEMAGGPGKEVTVEHYKKAMLQLGDVDRYVNVKRNFRGDTTETIEILPEALTGEDAAVARWAISPRAMDMWKAAGLPEDQLVQFAKSQATAAAAMDPANFAGKGLAEQQYLTRQVLEKHAEFMYKEALLRQQTDEERAKATADDLLSKLSESPLALRDLKYFSELYTTASYKDRFAAATDAAKQAEKRYRGPEKDVEVDGILYPVPSLLEKRDRMLKIAEYFNAMAAVEAFKNPPVKKGLKLEENK